MTVREIKRYLLGFAAFALFFFCVLTAKFHWESKRCYRAGEQALNEGRTEQAIVWFDRSIRSLSIFNGYGRKSVAQLLQIGETQLDQGRRGEAIETYQTVLSALAASDTGLSNLRKQTIASLKLKVSQLRKAEHEESKATDS